MPLRGDEPDNISTLVTGRTETPNLDIARPATHPLAAKLLKFHVVHYEDQTIVLYRHVCNL